MAENNARGQIETSVVTRQALPVTIPDSRNRTTSRKKKDKAQKKEDERREQQTEAKSRKKGEGDCVSLKAISQVMRIYDDLSL